MSRIFALFGVLFVAVASGAAEPVANTWAQSEAIIEVLPQI